MHEATIAQSILNILSSRLAITPDAGCVSNVAVKIGDFRNVDSESLIFAFNSLKSLYAGLSTCTLDIESIKTQAWCSKAGHRYNPSIERGYCCDQCDSGIGQLICGEELDVVKITLKSDAPEESKQLCMSPSMNTL